MAIHLLTDIKRRLFGAATAVAPPQSVNEEATVSALLEQAQARRTMVNDGMIRWPNAPVDTVSTPDAALVTARAALRDAFVTAHPIDEKAHFIGRTEPLSRLISAVSDEQSHALLFGERGRGKTSLLNMFAQMARAAGHIVIAESVTARTNFSDLFRACLQEIPQLYNRQLNAQALSEVGNRRFADLLPAGEFGARELAEILGQITVARIIIIIDEYDRLAHTPFVGEFAELLKKLSDHKARVHFVLAGVATDLEELIEEHPSVRRVLMPIYLGRMESGDALAMLKRGFGSAQMDCPEEILATILQRAAGSPYMLRLLAAQTGRVALEAGSFKITAEHLTLASNRVRESFAYSFRDQIEAITTHDPHATQILASAASAYLRAGDEFTVDDMGLNGEAVVTLAHLCEGHLPILRSRLAGVNKKYSFNNSLLAYYLTL